MANFTSITGKKKDYSIAELLGSSGAKEQSSAPSTQVQSGMTGTFTPAKSAASGAKESISDILSGVDSALGEIAPSLPGVTNIGAAIKSHYNSKGYEEDRAAAEARLETLDNSKPTYSESDGLKESREDLAELEGYWKEKYPDGYQSKYGDQISELIGKLGETEKFNYDIESDPLWNSVKDQYQRNAMLGMQDAIGNAASLTGGYGNSNAVIAGQQAYQQSISEMTDIIPELHDTALNAWQANRGALTDNLYAVMNAEDMEYSKWQNEYNMWATDREYMAQKVANMSDEEFSHYFSSLQSWQIDRDFYAGQKQQAIANQQWQTAMDESRRQFNQQMAFNYINMGVGAAVDLTKAGMSAGVSLAGIGADAALGAAGLALDQKQFNASLTEEARQFDASLAHDTAMSERDYELALKELAEDRRQFDIKNGEGINSTQAVGTQSVTGTVKSEDDEDDTPKKKDPEPINVPEDLRLYLKNADHYSDANESRLLAIQTSLNNGTINETTAKKLLTDYGIAY